MRPKYFFAAAALSLLMGAGTVWWWINSGTRMNQLTLRQSSGDSVCVYGCDGKLLLLRTMVPSQKTPQPVQLTWNTVPYAPGSDNAQPGLKWNAFSYSRNTLDKGATEASVVLPVWIVTAACSVMPLWWFNGKVKQLRKPAK